MKLSFFLAKVGGLYLVILGLFWATQKNKLQKARKELCSSTGLQVLTGAYSVLFGLFILMIHPVFEKDFRVLITLLFGILPIVKGLMRLFIIKEDHSYCKKMIQGKCRILMSLILLILGIYLAYMGFHPTAA